MTVDAAYQFIQFLARKNQTGSITPAEFAQSFNSSQRDFFNQLLGKITVAPHVALGKDERISERLRPFKVSFAVLSAAGQVAAYPEKFQALTLMTDQATGRAMQYVDDAKLAGRLNSKIDPIAEANPGVFVNTSTGWKIYPSTINAVSVSYYKLPEDVKWGYLPDGFGRPVYDQATSTQPLWDDVSAEAILAKACRLLGFSFEKQTLVQYAQTQVAEGV